MAVSKIFHFWRLTPATADHSAKDWSTSGLSASTSSPSAIHSNAPPPAPPARSASLSGWDEMAFDFLPN